MENSTQSSIQFGFPSPEIFKLPPSQPYKPAASLRAPPSNIYEPTFFYPFEIHPDVYHAALNIRFVLTFSLAYVTTVLFWNQYNTSRQYKPWAISRTFIFKAFVFMHNTLLSLFSAWVLGGILHGFYVHGPSAEGKDNYLAHLAEYLCQPDPDAFRQQGATYMGCLFYLSKYYEVVDTLIILAGGKKSSTLQTYHHAGVILCGWSAVFFESPMGAVGVLLNATVHTLMYAYFAIQTLGIRVPMSIKRSLTGIQIAQFLIGMVWSVSYLLLKYKVPSNIPETRGNVSIALESHISRVDSSIDSYTMMSCISDSGEANVYFVTNLYLLPLIYLFVQFFIRSYRKQK
ncbi:hypothetical protein N7520_011362 [Penicillium odoratum]|uniref:uncharacterized protein n=1 Tax=Penicillium odoratum TaxID=1167516 RepID=UPI00254818E2|nr:uncharacterized protein N7520_011362 [Penicillium odoratum]KAJ5746180.1 hypothetical protein N7520_011362 [Penicillium odoratum]